MICLDLQLKRPVASHVSLRSHGLQSSRFKPKDEFANKNFTLSFSLIAEDFFECTLR